MIAKLLIGVCFLLAIAAALGGMAAALGRGE